MEIKLGRKTDGSKAIINSEIIKMFVVGDIASGKSHFVINNIIEPLLYVGKQMALFDSKWIDYRKYREKCLVIEDSDLIPRLRFPEGSFFIIDDLSKVLIDQDAKEAFIKILKDNTVNVVVTETNPELIDEDNKDLFKTKIGFALSSASKSEKAIGWAGCEELESKKEALLVQGKNKPIKIFID